MDNMKRFVFLVLSCAIMLTGCSTIAPETASSKESASVSEPAVVPQIETFGSVEDGFRLSYPSSFELTDSDDDYYEFTDSEQDLSISLSIEENTYSDLSADEYPYAMGVDMYSKMLSENSFDRDIYVKDEESSYSIYTLTDDYIYCVEYNYQGKEGQESLINQLKLEVYGGFTGCNTTDTLQSYAEEYLTDLFGTVTDFTICYDGTRTVNSSEMATFTVEDTKNYCYVCLIAVNTDGACYVDYSLTTKEFVNIDLLLYDTTANTTDKLLYYATYYYNELYGSNPNAESINLYNADYYLNNQHLTVYNVSDDPAKPCLIGISDSGVGYVDYTGSGTKFQKIES